MRRVRLDRRPGVRTAYAHLRRDGRLEIRRAAGRNVNGEGVILTEEGWRKLLAFLGERQRVR